MLRFVQKLIQFRTELPKRNNQTLTLPEILQPATITWHGTELGKPDWSESSRSVALTIRSPAKWYHLIFNAYWEAIRFEIPSLPANSNGWQRIIDTSQLSPEDIDLHPESNKISSYEVAARSSVLLVGDVETSSPAGQ